MYEDCQRAGVNQPGLPRCAVAALTACVIGSMRREGIIESLLQMRQVVTLLRRLVMMQVRSSLA
jgi:hypothetical protein